MFCYLFLSIVILTDAKVINININANTNTKANANMNGIYQVASGARQNVKFETDFSKRGFEYFDLYSLEVQTEFAEVHWPSAPQVPLPDYIINRFKNRTLVIVGYEVDQVFVTPEGYPNLNPELDVSVPITWAYNHHYNFIISGSSYYNIPDKQEFSEGNGGEFRKSFHGYPDGYGQLLYSPTQYIAMIMQIDTRNRACGVSPNDLGKCVTENMFGLEPKQARYGRKDPNSNVSGLIHCPCTSSFGGDPVIYGLNTKTKSKAEVTFILNKQCLTGNMLNRNDCFDLTKKFPNHNIQTKIINSPNVPSGCSLIQSKSNGTIVFNTRINSEVPCFNNITSKRQGTITQEKVGMNLTMIINNDIITYKLSGYANGWFAVGFNAQRMMDLPWTIIVYPNGTFEERILGYCNVEGNHCSGPLLDATLRFVSKHNNNGILDIVLEGPTSSSRYDFTDRITIQIIMAQGIDENLVYHKNRIATNIILIPDDTGNTGLCACITYFGALCDAKGANCVSFVKDCKDELISSNNPTCTAMTYGGGLSCCTHKRVLLDEDQLNLTENSLLRYHLKWRFYFDDGSNSNKYKNLERLYFQTEDNAGEYDVPPAFVEENSYPIVGYPLWPKNVPTPNTVCENGTCMHVLKHHYKFDYIYDMKLIYVSAHFHINGISMQLWLNTSGTEILLCSQIPIRGKGIGKQFDEAGYITIPPCLFDEKGYLDKPPIITRDSILISVKYTENTYNGNFGEMASWQMRGVII